jgi:hypothetical protein
VFSESSHWPGVGKISLSSSDAFLVLILTLELDLEASGMNIPSSINLR